MQWCSDSILPKAGLNMVAEFEKHAQSTLFNVSLLLHKLKFSSITSLTYPLFNNENLFTKEVLGRKLEGRANCLTQQTKKLEPSGWLHQCQPNAPVGTPLQWVNFVCSGAQNWQMDVLCSENVFPKKTPWGSHCLALGMTHVQPKLLRLNKSKKIWKCLKKSKWFNSLLALTIIIWSVFCFLFWQSRIIVSLAFVSWIVALFCHSQARWVVINNDQEVFTEAGQSCSLWWKHIISEQDCSRQRLVVLGMQSLSILHSIIQPKWWLCEVWKQFPEIVHLQSHKLWLQTSSDALEGPSPWTVCFFEAAKHRHTNWCHFHWLRNLTLCCWCRLVLAQTNLVIEEGWHCAATGTSRNHTLTAGGAPLMTAKVSKQFSFRSRALQHAVNRVTLFIGACCVLELHTAIMAHECDNLSWQCRCVICSKLCVMVIPGGLACARACTCACWHPV